MPRPVPIAMTSALARLVDRTSLPRHLNGRSVRATVNAQPDASPGRRPGPPRLVAASARTPAVELAIRTSLWQLFSAACLLIAIAILVTYLATGAAPLPASGPGRALYLPVVATTAVSLGNSMCAAVIASGRFPRRTGPANAIWLAIVLVFGGILLLAYLA